MHKNTRIFYSRYYEGAQRDESLIVCQIQAVGNCTHTYLDNEHDKELKDIRSLFYFFQCIGEGLNIFIKDKYTKIAIKHNNCQNWR